MDAKGFFELVGRMRAAQQDYFARRQQSDLIQAKALEKKVDEALAAGYVMLTTSVPAQEEYLMRLHMDEQPESPYITDEEVSDEEVELRR